MTTITFYEKLGCGNNTRQKALLSAAGHEVIARNLPTEPWTPERVLAFFGEHPVADWFNRAAPRVKLNPARSCPSGSMQPVRCSSCCKIPC